MPLNYMLIRTNRRTIAIKIKNKQVVVYAPIFMTKESIEGFVLQHQKWIENKLNKEVINLNISLDNDEIYILGRKYEFSAQYAKVNEVEIIDDLFIVRGKTENTIKQVLVNYLQDIVKNRIMLIKKELNIDFDFDFKFYKSRWGCCYPQKKLIIMNLYCACLPMELIDAVIYHEITHLKVSGHNAKFYALLNKMCPEYKKLSAELKKYSL